MARPRFQAPKGTRDLLPPDTALWAAVEATAREVFSRYGYQEIRTPIFEDTDLFVRGVGESSDIVGKEMYTFEDKGGRSVTLRPESTAAVCRAYVEHGMQSLPQPVRLYYIGPQFRYERPQKGRFREFHQIGAELLGAKGALGEVEVLAMLDTFFAELGFEERAVLLNTVGDQESRARFRQELVAYLTPLAERLSEESRRRLLTNPLRILDSKSREEQELLVKGPQLGESLTPASRANYEEVRAALGELGIRFHEAPHLVRGLDYYTETVFEIVSLDERLGSQNALCGGGSYDGLIEELGGPQTPGVGFAIGEDRLTEVLPAEFRSKVTAAQPFPIWVAVEIEEDDTGGPMPSAEAIAEATVVAETLRRARFRVHSAPGPRRLRSVRGDAAKAGAPLLLLVSSSRTKQGTVGLVRFEHPVGLRGSGILAGVKWLPSEEVAVANLLDRVRFLARTPEP